MVAHDRIRKKFERLVREARVAGLLVVADYGAIAIRLIPKSDVSDSSNLSLLGETVSVDNACGDANVLASHPNS